jgi:hypothetical protein
VVAEGKHYSAGNRRNTALRICSCHQRMHWHDPECSVPRGSWSPVTLGVDNQVKLQDSRTPRTHVPPRCASSLLTLSCYQTLRETSQLSNADPSANATGPSHASGNALHCSLKAMCT